MANVVKPQQTNTPPARPAAAGPRPGAPVRPSAPRPARAPQPKREYTMLFDRDNYLLMVGGVALIFIGFLLMSGGKSANPHEFHYEEIYSFRRITLAPIVVLLGFTVEVFAIMKKPKDKTPELL